MKEYIESLEHDFSLIENGFKVEEKRALDDYKAHDREYIKELALLAYKSEVECMAYFFWATYQKMMTF